MYTTKIYRKPKNLIFYLIIKCKCFRLRCEWLKCKNYRKLVLNFKLNIECKFKILWNNKKHARWIWIRDIQPIKDTPDSLTKNYKEHLFKSVENLSMRINCKELQMAKVKKLMTLEKLKFFLPRMNWETNKIIIIILL